MNCLTINNKIMKEFKITEEQIKENKDLTLKEYFKEVFEETHKIGFWYKHPKNSLFNVTSIDEFGALYGYGLFNCEYREYSNEYNTYLCACNSIAKIDLVLATEEEVFNALKKEAEKRGFIKGVKFISIDNKKETILDEEINYRLIDNCLFIGLRDYSGVIFNNGKWAEIISQPDEVIELNGVKYKRID